MKRWWILLGIGVALGAGVTLAAVRFTQGAVAQERTAIAFTNQERITLASLESALTRIAEAVQPTVVHIRAIRRVESPAPRRWRLPLPDQEELPDVFRSEIPQPRIEGQGSGVIIRSDGYIVTNDHVVSNATKVEVTFHDGTKAEGTVLRAPSADIALVKVDRRNLPAASLGDSSTVKPGQIAFAIGSPFGLENTITMGIISAVGRREVISDAGATRYYLDLIQTDAAINSGNSGDPLVNSQGEVIGINTAIVSNGFTGGNVGIGFAIPSNRVKMVVRKLLEEGTFRRGYLGVGLRDLTPEEREELGVREGAFVASVEEGTPAYKAGIRPGDVITALDGKRVRNEVTLRDLIAEKGPNARVSIEYLRDGKTYTTQATLGVHPEDENPPKTQEVSKSEPKVVERLGIKVKEAPRDTRARSEQGGGVLVESVASDSPVYDQLRPGDIILSVNGETVDSPEAFEKALQKISSGRTVRLIVKRTLEQRTILEFVTFRMP